jgi:hypothetical protein
MAIDFFAGVPVAGHTGRFFVTYASPDDIDALGRAQAILETCDRDMETLQEWFHSD